MEAGGPFSSHLSFQLSVCCSLATAKLDEQAVEFFLNQFHPTLDKTVVLSLEKRLHSLPSVSHLRFTFEMVKDWGVRRSGTFILLYNVD